ncbi:GNAT family N-acetyltransferase [Streptomyces sp. NPDC004266]|uniref:GNAT family N-acetyltransferase n=1 Tax=Streptomyces sp. NPDC004266 TaxID=3364693 RepID=UPI0036CE758C
MVEPGAADVPEVPDLTARTRPGPFWPRTRALGTCLGIRAGGRLVAMAGERSGMGAPPAEGRGSLRPPGRTEISAVRTGPEARGQGCAALLPGALVARVLDRHEHPLPHVAEKNTGAIALYGRLGFTSRKHVAFRGFRIP